MYVKDSSARPALPKIKDNCIQIFLFPLHLSFVNSMHSMPGNISLFRNNFFSFFCSNCKIPSPSLLPTPSFLPSPTRIPHFPLASHFLLFSVTVTLSIHTCTIKGPACKQQLLMRYALRLRHIKIP